MINNSKKILIGFVNTVGSKPSFLVPTFAEGNTLYFQSIDNENNRITSFYSYEIDIQQVIKVNCEITKEVGDPGLYAFALNDNNIYYGSKEELIEKLKQNEGEIKKYPFTYFEVLKFIGEDERDEKIVKQIIKIENKLAYENKRIANKWTDSFSQTLSEEEEKILVRKYKQGDEDARNTLVERNLKLVARIVQKFKYAGIEIDDLISIGTIGLIKSITTYDSNKRIGLSAYAKRCIENEILMTVRSTKKLKPEVFLSEPIGVDEEGNEIFLMDILNSDKVDNESESQIQAKKLQNKIASVLKGREKMILELRYGLISGKCKTQMEVAQLLGISRSYVSRLEKRALRKLGKEFIPEINK